MLVVIAFADSLAAVAWVRWRIGRDRAVRFDRRLFHTEHLPCGFVRHRAKSLSQCGALRIGELSDRGVVDFLRRDFLCLEFVFAT